LADVKQVQQSCKEYTEELYDKEGKPQDKEAYLEKITQEDAKGPPILYCEL